MISFSLYRNGDQVVQDKLGPHEIFISSFAISSLGGLAALLRSNKELSVRSVISAMLYSGILGLIIALMWYNYFDGNNNIYFLLSVSGLAGIGGASVLDFIIAMMKNGGVNVIIKPTEDDDSAPKR